MIDEGAIKFDARWQRMPPLGGPVIEDLIRWRKPLYRAGLVGHDAAHDVGYGNLSARLGDGRQFAISGTQTGHIEAVTASHFATVTDYDIDANVVMSSGPVQASSESLTHAAIYELDPSIRGVVHVHDERLWAAMADSLPATAAHVAYGTPEMAREFMRLYEETRFAVDGVALMAGHLGGLIGFGRSVGEAAERMLALCESVRDRQE